MTAIISSHIRLHHVLSEPICIQLNLFYVCVALLGVLLIDRCFTAELAPVMQIHKRRQSQEQWLKTVRKQEASVFWQCLDSAFTTLQPRQDICLLKALWLKLRIFCHLLCVPHLVMSENTSDLKQISSWYLNIWWHIEYGISYIAGILPWGAKLIKLDWILTFKK